MSTENFPYFKTRIFPGTENKVVERLRLVNFFMCVCVCMSACIKDQYNIAFLHGFNSPQVELSVSVYWTSCHTHYSYIYHLSILICFSRCPLVTTICKDIPNILPYKIDHNQLFHFLKRHEPISSSTLFH